MTNRTVTLTLLLILGFPLALLAQPEGYQFLRHGGELCRLSRDRLPFRVLVETGPAHRLVLHAIRTWNGVGHRAGFPDLFAPVDNSAQADLVIDWSGRGLPADKAGAVWWEMEREGPRVRGLSIDPSLRPGNQTQVLMQELGHVLGLGDSMQPRDLMHPVMHRRRYHDYRSVRPTSRDEEAFRWLYSQPVAVSIGSFRLPDRPVREPILSGGPSGLLRFEPALVERRGSVNIRVRITNPGTEVVKGPVHVIVWARADGQAWTELKSWQWRKIDSGKRMSRDLFLGRSPLFLGPFELRLQATTPFGLAAERLQRL